MKKADALLDLICKKDLEGVKKFILSKIDAKRDQRVLDEALHTTALAGYRPEIAEYLLQVGANVDYVSTLFDTPLIRATETGDLATVKVLVAAGADVNREINGQSALSIAKKKYRGDLIRFLEEHGAQSAAGKADAKQATSANASSVAERQRNIEEAIDEMDWPPLHEVYEEYSTPSAPVSSAPERVLFDGEWLIKPAPKGAESAHILGGALASPVACVYCGDKSHLMAQIDLADPGLPETPLGRGKLPVFWCLDCSELDTSTFFDLSGAVPVPLPAPGKTAETDGSGLSEDDLPEKRVVLVPVPAGKKAGRKSKLGGKPAWIQNEEKPVCPKCGQPMAFVLQLASDSRISFCDMGMLYAFACPEYRTTASLIQSH